MSFKIIAAISILFIGSVLSAQTPELSLKNIDGQRESLSDYRGSIVVLNFWATWCIPCRKEMPLFVKLQSEYKSDGVQWIAVSTDTEEIQSQIGQFVEEYRIDFPVWIGGTPEQQASFKLGTGLPATVIIDREGLSRFRIIGEASELVLRERIEYLMSAKSADAPDELVLPPGITPEHFREHELGLEEDHEHEEEIASAGSEVPS